MFVVINGSTKVIKKIDSSMPECQKDSLSHNFYSVKDPAKPKRRYECDICLYVAEVEGELPDDYICPICGADRSHFKEI